MTNAPRGFLFKTIMTDAGPLAVAQFICIACKEVLNINNSNSGKEPGWFVAKATNQGWQADERRPNRCYCPKCLHSSTTLSTDITLAKEPKMEHKVPGAVRDPTIEERVRIRSYLDKSFDDKVGSYLDGMSDQEIGRLTNVPWAIVTKIREAAYGPIRTDPELVAIERKIKEMASAIEHLRNEFDTYKKQRMQKHG